MERDDRSRRIEEARRRLREQYIASFPEKIAALEAVLRQVRDGGEGATKQARTLSHRLAGSGGSYGFDELSALARQAEHADVSTLEQDLGRLVALIRNTLASETQERPRILIVEHDVTTADRLLRALTEIRGDIHVCQTAREAELKHAEWRSDVVLLDLDMPGDGARELLGHLQVGIHDAHTPLVLLVQQLDSDKRRESIELGAEHILEKAVDPELLCVAVRSVLEKRKKIVESARRDPLTGLLNRAGFQDELQRAQGLAGRTQMQFSVGLIDLDRFKDVNDIYGHGMGDRVLKGFADILRARLRASDVFARWGGEEFIVLLPNTPASGAVLALDQVRLALKQSTFDDGRQQVSELSFSAGVVDFDDRVDVELVIEHADQLLYKAKAAGRDRILDMGGDDGARDRLAIVIEDDDDTAALVAGLLAEEGVAVCRFSDGTEALERLFEQTFDLVILDVDLPGASGMDILDAIRSEPRLRRVPVVMLTAAVDETDIESSFDRGADEYICKPFRPREASARFRRLLQRSEPPASLPRGVTSSHPPDQRG